MEKLMVINENLVNVRNKVANLYKKLSPDLFNENKTIKDNDDLLEARLLRVVNEETTPYK